MNFQDGMTNVAGVDRIRQDNLNAMLEAVNHRGANSLNVQPLPLLDIREFAQALWRQRLLILLIAALGMAVAIWYVVRTAPQFTATSRVLIDTRPQTVVNIQDVLPGLSPETAVIESQVEILGSRHTIQRALRRMGEKEQQQLTEGIDKASKLQAGTDNPSEFLIKNVMERLRIERLGLSYIIDVSFTDKSPTLAARIANAIAEEYVENQRDDKYNATKWATEELEKRVQKLGGEVRAAVNKVHQYKARHNLLDVGELKLSEREIIDYGRKLVAARAHVIETQARAMQVEHLANSPEQLMTIGKALQSNVIAEFRRQHAEVRRKLGDLISRYGENHGSVANARAELENLNREIQLEINRLVKSARNEFELAKMEVSLLGQGLDELKKKYIERSRAAIELTELERHAEATQQLYGSLLKRLKETETQKGMQTADASIAAYAAPPLSPSWPKKKLVLALALIASFGIGILVALLRHSLDTVLRVPSDVTRQFGLKAVSSLPIIKSRKRRSSKTADTELRGKSGGSRLLHVLNQKESSYTQAIFQLSRWIVGACANGRTGIAIIASAKSGEGKTTTAANLAHYAARCGHKTLLIDCDLRASSLTGSLYPDAELSLVDIVLREVDPSSVIKTSSESALDFCPGPLWDTSFAPSEIMGSQRLKDTLLRFAAQYDLVIVDTSAALECPDSLALFDHADCAILVARAERTTRQDINSVLNHSDLHDTLPIGIALNMVGKEISDQTRMKRQKLDRSVPVHSTTLEHNSQALTDIKRKNLHIEVGESTIAEIDDCSNLMRTSKNEVFTKTGNKKTSMPSATATHSAKKIVAV